MSGQKHPEPLDRDERELAEALARTFRADPAPGIDAAVLACARAEAARRKTGTDAVPSGSGGRSRRSRKPAWLRGGALAASLVVASGVAWQLRLEHAVPALSDDAAEHRAGVPQATGPEATPRPAPVRSMAPAPAQARTIEAPASPAEPVRKRSPSALQAEDKATGAALAPDPDTAAAAAWLDHPVGDTPPASVDSPQVREAWLARIRELVAAGHHEEARASYAEFRRRHPDAPVPDDLRMLLDGE